MNGRIRGTPACFIVQFVSHKPSGEIERLAGRGADGESWFLDSKRAIRGIEAGIFKFVLARGDRREPLVISADSTGNTYLTSQGLKPGQAPD